MKKIFSIFLLISILASIVSCGTETVNDPVQSSSQDTTTAVTETEAISSDLPDVTYDGYEFKFLSSDEVGSVRYSSELFAESENGEPVNDAVYKRNRMVEERFDVKISKIEQNKSDVVNSFKNSVLAGDNEYDVLVHQMDSVLTMAYLYGAPVSELKYVDIDKPWWDGDIIRQTAVKGKAFTLTGDINLVDNKATWCLLFNKRLADEYIDGDLYETVRSGKWTLQKLAECCKLASHDLNGDGAMDYQDQWGMLASGNVAASFIWSCGGGFGRTDKNGDIELTIDSERNINALEKTYELFADRDSVIDINRIPNGENGLTNWGYQRKMFNDGRALFIGGLAQYVEYYREMEDEFGILPLPKYDEDQSDYICTAQEWCATMLLVPKTAPDLDRTSVLLEALASASVSTITPAYYDVTLQRKHTRDDESKEMLDIIFNSRIFDVVYAYNWGGVRSIANNLTADSNTIASSIASLKIASATALEKFIGDLE